MNNIEAEILKIENQLDRLDSEKNSYGKNSCSALKWIEKRQRLIFKLRELQMIPGIHRTFPRRFTDVR